MRTLLFVLVLTSACAKVPPVEPAQGNATYTKSMDLRPNLGGGTITFDTGTFRGTIEIGTGLLFGYTNTTQAGTAGHTSTTILTIDGRELVIEPTRLRVGEHIIGPLAGEVKIDINKDGVFVDGAKKSDL